MAYIDIVLQVLPVIGLITLGFALQRFSLFRPEAVKDMKNLVVSIALPSLLFIAFSRLELEPRHLVVVATVFTTCVVMVLIGSGVRKLFGITSRYFPLLFGGFETGMIGYAIFISVYGSDNVGSLAIVDLGQVTFVFFVLVALLKRLDSQEVTRGSLLRMFFTSPVVIGIFAGIAVSLIKTAVPLEESGLYLSFVQFLTLLGNLTVPLITIIIGYELKIDRSILKLPFLTIALRSLFLLVFAVLIGNWVFRGFLGLDPIYEKALITMFVLPPPFVIPLFMNEDDRSDMQYVVNTLSLSTVFSLALFIVVTAIFA